MYAGDDVKLAGITVGEVTHVEVVEGEARVEFTVDQGVQLPSDTVAAVRWRNLIGQRFLGLEPGTGEEMLREGDEVQVTKDVVDLGDLVNQLVPLAQAVSPDQVNEILTTLLQAFEGNDATFDELLRDVDGVLAVLADRDQTIDQLLSDYATISDAVASRDQQIGQMVDNLVSISSTFAENDQLLDDALIQLAQLSHDLDGLLDSSAADLGASLDSLAVLTGTATDHVDELEDALQNLPALFEVLLPVVNRGEWLRVSVLCVVTTPGQCPYPTSTSGGEGENPFVIDPGGVLGGLLGGLGLG
jgi:phospholipid/cholesterol/gamma-HCH transport system substrate-binding protein